MNKAKNWIYVILVLWTIIWTIIVGVIVWWTKNKIFYFLLFISFICLFDILIWYFVQEFPTKLDRFTSFSFLLVLNIPAYFLAKHIRAENMLKEQKIYNDKYQVLLEDTNNETLTEKELQTFDKKVEKQINSTENIDWQLEYVESPIFDFNQEIINQYCIFLAQKILKENENLTETYLINQLIREEIGENSLNIENIHNFCSDINHWYPTNKLNDDIIIKDFRGYCINLLETSGFEEIYITYKQNRVAILLEAHKLLS